MLNLSNDQAEQLHERESAAVYKIIFNKVYILCYYIGIYTVLAIKTVANFAKLFSVSAINKLNSLLSFVWSKIKNSKATIDIKRICKGYKVIFQQTLEVKKSDSFSQAVKTHFRLLNKAVSRNKKTAVSLLNHMAPIAAVGVLIFTICFWSGATFALEVRYNDTVAYVNDETVLNDAFESVKERILTEDGKELISKPEYSLKLVSSKNLIDREEMSNLIVSNTDMLCEATGIYKDNQLLAVCGDTDEIQSSIDEYLNSFKTDEEIKSVDFSDNIELITGIYPVSYLKPATEIKSDYFSSGVDTALCVKVVRNVTYTEEIAHDSVEIQDSNKSRNYRRITKEGSNGLASICAEVTTVGGVEVDRVVLASEVIKEPESEQITVGTAEPKKSSTTKALTAANTTVGDFAWPIKRVAGSYISSYFGDNRNHKGYDFAAPRGTDIYSVDDGTVVSMNSSGRGYGLHFVIDHGNGIKTLYAHCSVVNVKLGQKVSRGEKIAEVGRTGYATGNHLHFEVWENGRAVNPSKYFGR